MTAVSLKRRQQGQEPMLPQHSPQYTRNHVKYFADLTRRLPAATPTPAVSVSSPRECSSNPFFRTQCAAHTTTAPQLLRRRCAHGGEYRTYCGAVAREVKAAAAVCHDYC